MDKHVLQVALEEANVEGVCGYDKCLAVEFEIRRIGDFLGTFVTLLRTQVGAENEDQLVSILKYDTHHHTGGGNVLVFWPDIPFVDEDEESEDDSDLG